MIEFDVFISYSSKDKVSADAACSALENAGVRCWMAPRDIIPGTDWGESILDALDHCRAMVLIFSASANSSPQIRREIERAVDRGVALLPVRIENIVPTKALAYFMGPVHWLDAMTPPLDHHLKRLAEVAKTILRTDAEKAPADAAEMFGASQQPFPAAPAPAAPPRETVVAYSAPPPSPEPLISQPPPPPPPAEPIITPASPPPPEPAVGHATPPPLPEPAKTPPPRPKLFAGTPLQRPEMLAAAIAGAIVLLLMLGFGAWKLMHPTPPVVVAGQLSITGPDTASFSGPVSGPFTPSQVTFQLKASGGGFDWAVDDSIPQWISVTPSRGHVADNGTVQVTVALAAAAAQALSQGRYEGVILFKDLANSNTLARTARLDITAPSQTTTSTPTTPTSPGAESVSGTNWSGTANSHIFELEFQADHTLRYHTEAGWFTNGTWSQNGNSIHLEMNNNYAEYDGTIDGDRMQGTAKNIRSATWTWAVTKQKSGSPPPAVEGGLAGTKWTGTANTDIFEVEFHSDHTLRYHNESGWFDDGIWSQNSNNTIHMEMNNKYSWYDGTIDGDRMEGTAKNKVGLSWTWSLTKQAQN